MNAIIEKKIEQAFVEGEFENLDGKGKPLTLDDDRLVPPPLRMAYRILKNAGMSPHEVQVLGEINTLKEELRQTDDHNYRTLLASQIAWLQTQHKL